VLIHFFMCCAPLYIKRSRDRPPPPPSSQSRPSIAPSSSPRSTTKYFQTRINGSWQNQKAKAHGWLECQWWINNVYCAWRLPVLSSLDSNLNSLTHPVYCSLFYGVKPSFNAPTHPHTCMFYYEVYEHWCFPSFVTCRLIHPISAGAISR
jgi:hypothetical protein